MSAQDLTTLAALKSWLGLPSGVTPNDATLSALITAASRAIYSALSRPAILPQSYSEVLDAESERVFLRHWPVLALTTATLDGVALAPIKPPLVPGVIGYLLQPGDSAPPGRPQALDLHGYRFHSRRQNLIVNYSAGYGVLAEARNITATSPYTLAALSPYGPWATDAGVVYASSGSPLTPVAAAPTAGQYSVSAGLYTFSAGDAGAAVSLSYGFVPQDLAQAAMELAAERFRAAERIGLRSKSIGGQETISYDVSAISAPILGLLQPYRRVAV